MDSPTTGMVHIMEKKMVPGKCLVMMCKEKDNFFCEEKTRYGIFFIWNSSGKTALWSL